MSEGLRRTIGYTRSVFFSLAIHSFIIALLIAELWWPFYRAPVVVERAPTIEATAVSLEEIQKQRNQQALLREQEEQRLREIEEQKKREAEAEKLAIEQEKQRIQEAERQRAEQERLEQERREQEEARKIAEQEEQIRLAEERKKAEEVERKRKEEEARKKAEEEERIRKEEEERKKAEEERRRKEEEARKKAEEEERKRKEEEERKKAKEAEKKRLEEERKRAEEEELLKELEALAFKSHCESNLKALEVPIQKKINDNWRRPSQDVVGLQALISVRVSINGKVLSAKVTSSSGDLKFDRSAEIATQNASPLPFPTNLKCYEYIKEYTIRFKPDG
ncbi:MAG: cell envelope integrity protein TolA [Gammaproteobacteria bacterium]|nr:cell envelope integrity protein TolA [Gammaproteobacteria bacterium]